MTKTKPKSEHKKLGRPTVFTKELVDKLKYCFAKGLTDREASDYVGISRDALNKYGAANPDFIYQKEALKGQLVVRGKFNLSDAVEAGSIQDSKWLLERKCKDEFSLRTENTGKGGGPIEVDIRNTTVLTEKEFAEASREQLKAWGLKGAITICTEEGLTEARRKLKEERENG